MLKIIKKGDKSMNNFDKEFLYNQSAKRWQKAEASLDGIMDGFASVHEIDAKDSCLTLENLIANNQINPTYAIDCAAGIGRVSQHVLTKYFSKIDILERDKKFTEYWFEWHLCCMDRDAD